MNTKENKTILNSLPTPTWSWLKLNRAELSFDSDAEISFENQFPEIRALENQDNGKETVKVLEKTGQNGKEKFSPENKNKDRKSFSEAENLFEKAVPLEITSDRNSKTGNPLVLSYELNSGKNTSSHQIINAGENSEISVIIFVSSENQKSAEENPAENTETFQTLKTEIHAAPYSKVHLVKVQLLGENFIQIDETKTFADENAEIEVTHIVLGGKKTYISVGSELEGYKSEFKSDLGYFCKGEQELDLNYIANHHGKKTKCRMNVFGALKDKAKKTYRGTIDLKNGAEGADGDEQEETLLLSPEVINNSIPVILCTEEDVAGEHGATIGRISDEILFYMNSRGIGKEEAENILARSKVQRVANKIMDTEISEKTGRFMDELFGVN